MIDPQEYQAKVLRQLNSIRTAVWIAAVALLVGAVVAIAVALYAVKMLPSCKSEVFRPQYQRNLRELLAENKIDEALKAATQRKATNPGDPYAWYSSGLAYYHMKDWTNALHDLKEAQTLSPTWEKDFTGPYIKTIEGILTEQKQSQSRQAD